MRYTTGQITKILNISRPTLYNLCKKKKIRPQRTAGGNYRYSEENLKELLEQNLDEKDLETSFVEAVNDIWVILKKLADNVWGVDQGEERLVQILQKNKNDIFILNISNFKEIKDVYSR